MVYSIYKCRQDFLDIQYVQEAYCQEVIFSQYTHQEYTIGLGFLDIP